MNQIFDVVVQRDRLSCAWSGRDTFEFGATGDLGLFQRNPAEGFRLSNLVCIGVMERNLIENRWPSLGAVRGFVVEGNPEEEPIFHRGIGDGGQYVYLLDSGEVIELGKIWANIKPLQHYLD